MKKILVLLVSFTVAFFAGCEQNSSGDPVSTHENESYSGYLQKTLFDNIVEANQNFMTAFSNQDAEAMAALYTQDAKLLPPNSDFVVGNEAVKNFWGGLFTAGADEAILETLEVFGTGSTASEVGTFVIKSNGVELDHGKYVVVWKKVQGKFYLHRDCWNSSNPAP